MPTDVLDRPTATPPAWQPLVEELTEKVRAALPSGPDVSVRPVVVRYEHAGGA
jgi:hypothetical protein